MSDSMHGKKWYATALIAVLVLFVLVSVVVRWRMEPVKPLGKDAPASQFSAGRAAEALAFVLGDQKPHPVDSSAAEGVRERITSTLEGLGYRVEVQDSSACLMRWFTTCARVRNVIAVHEGTSPGKAILLSAHYDSVAAGPGASDAGSAVGALLEVARLLKRRPAGKNTVILLFNEGEEAGLHGADAFVSEHPLANHVAVAINLEARGTSGQSVMFETGDRSGWLVSRFSSASKRPLTNSLLYEAYRLLPNDTDMTVFKSKGMQGLNFAFGEHVAQYHTSLDNLENMNLGSLQQHGDNAYDVVEALIDADLIAGNADGNKVYTDILGITVVHWPVAWALAIAGALLVLFALAAWRLKKTYPFPWSGLTWGFLSFPVSLVVAGGVAYALGMLMGMINGGSMPWHSDALGNRLLLWSVVLLAVVSAQRLLARNTHPVGFWIGLCLPWLVMALLSSFALPGTSYLFVLPCIATVAAALLTSWMSRRFGERSLSMLFVLPAMAAYLAIFPAIFLVEIMLGFNALQGLIGMAVLLGLVATFIAPLLGAAAKSSAHRFAVYALVALVLAGAVLSMRAPAHTPSQPQALNVMYLQDGNGKAFMIAGNQYQPPPRAVAEAMGKPLLLEPILPWTETRQHHAAMPSLGLSAPDLTLVSEQASDKGREVVAQLDTGATPYKIVLMIPETAGLVSISIDGMPLKPEHLPKVVRGHHVLVCQGESCDGRQVRLVMSSAQPVPALIARITSGLPADLKPVARSRGKLAVPIGDGDQTIVMSEASL